MLKALYPQKEFRRAIETFELQPILDYDDVDTSVDTNSTLSNSTFPNSVSNSNSSQSANLTSVNAAQTNGSNSNSNNSTKYENVTRENIFVYLKKLRLFSANTLLGSPRLRQLRVKNGSCKSEKGAKFISVKHRCYPEYDKEDEDTDPFGPKEKSHTG